MTYYQQNTTNEQTNVINSVQHLLIKQQIIIIIIYLPQFSYQVYFSFIYTYIHTFTYIRIDIYIFYLANYIYIFTFFVFKLFSKVKETENARRALFKMQTKNQNNLNFIQNYRVARKNLKALNYLKLYYFSMILFNLDFLKKLKIKKGLQS